MSETSPSRLTQFVNRVGHKPFAAAGGTALWKAIDDVNRRQDEIRSRQERLRSDSTKLRERLKRQRELGSDTRGRVRDLEVEVARLTGEIQNLTRGMSQLDDQVRSGAEELANLSSLPRPRATPGQHPRPGRATPGKPEAQLGDPLRSLSTAVGITRTD